MPRPRSWTALLYKWQNVLYKYIFNPNYLSRKGNYSHKTFRYHLKWACLLKIINFAPFENLPVQMSNFFIIKLPPSLLCLSFILWRFMIRGGKLCWNHRIWWNAPVKKAKKMMWQFSRCRVQRIGDYILLAYHRVWKRHEQAHHEIGYLDGH